MPDPSDPAPPTNPPPKRSRTRRSPKFVLPEHHHDEREDERTAEHIEAFLAAPTVPRRRRHKVANRPRRPVELETRPDWTAALRHETARHARYGRPASVLLIELTDGPVTTEADRIARALAAAIRAEARETDRAVRLGALSFRILLPETGDRAARAVAERLDRTFLANDEARELGAGLTIAVATAADHGTLEDALAEAERRLAASASEG